MLRRVSDRMWVSKDPNNLDRQETDYKDDRCTGFVTAMPKDPDNLKQFPTRYPGMFMHPDTGNENLFHFFCLSCVSLPGTTSSGDCRNAICNLFGETVPFSPHLSGGPVREGVPVYESRQAAWHRL